MFCVEIKWLMIDKLLNTPESNNEIQNTNHPLCILQSLNCYSQTGNDTKAVILNAVPVEKYFYTQGSQVLKLQATCRTQFLSAFLPRNLLTCALTLFFQKVHQMLTANT